MPSCLLLVCSLSVPSTCQLQLKEAAGLKRWGSPGFTLGMYAEQAAPRMLPSAAPSAAAWLGN